VRHADLDQVDAAAVRSAEIRPKHGAPIWNGIAWWVGLKQVWLPLLRDGLLLQWHGNGHFVLDQQIPRLGDRLKYRDV